MVANGDADDKRELEEGWGLFSVSVCVKLEDGH